MRGISLVAVLLAVATLMPEMAAAQQAKDYRLFGRGRTKRKIKVAVMPFAQQGVDERVARIMDTLLAQEVHSQGRFQVLGLNELNAVLGLEKMKEAIGCNDITCAAEIGGALGVRFIVSGVLGRLGSRLMINLMYIDTEKLAVLKRVTHYVKHDEDLFPGALREATDKLFKQDINAVPLMTKEGKDLEAQAQREWQEKLQREQLEAIERAKAATAAAEEKARQEAAAKVAAEQAAKEAAERAAAEQVAAKKAAAEREAQATAAAAQAAADRAAAATAAAAQASANQAAAESAAAKAAAERASAGDAAAANAAAQRAAAKATQTQAAADRAAASRGASGKMPVHRGASQGSAIGGAGSAGGGQTGADASSSAADTVAAGAAAQATSGDATSAGSGGVRTASGPLSRAERRAKAAQAGGQLAPEVVAGGAPAGGTPAGAVVATPVGGGSDTMFWLGVGSAAVGLAAVGTGVAFGMMARSKGQDIAQSSTELDGKTVYFAPGHLSAAEAKQQELLANILLGVGAACLVASVPLFLFSGDDDDSTTAMILPMLGSHVGLAATVRW